VMTITMAGATICYRNYDYYPNNIEIITGTIQSTRLNTLKIYDELDKRVKSLIDLKQDEAYYAGEYVRVYFHPDNGIVVKIKRMTVLAYKKNGQNLGNIFHQNP